MLHLSQAEMTGIHRNWHEDRLSPDQGRIACPDVRRETLTGEQHSPGRATDCMMGKESRCDRQCKLEALIAVNVNNEA